MYIIGLTGGTGAGKTSAVKALQSLGAAALDCDEIYHELLASSTDMTNEIEARFNNVTTDGKIDRRKLGEIVWSDPVALNDLNLITHKYLSVEIDRRVDYLRTQGVKLIAVDAIALIESGQSRKCDVVVGVAAKLEKRIARIMERDNLTREQAQMRIDAQQPESFFNENCEYMLVNTENTMEAFEDKCVEFFKGLLKWKM